MFYGFLRFPNDCFLFLFTFYTASQLFSELGICEENKAIVGYYPLTNVAYLLAVTKWMHEGQNREARLRN